MTTGTQFREMLTFYALLRNASKYLVTKQDSQCTYNLTLRPVPDTAVVAENYITQCATDLEHLYRIYSIPTHDKHQWLLLQFIVLLMMDAKGARNM